MHRSKTNWLKFFFIVPLIWASPSKSDENARQIKNATDKLINHYSDKLILDIKIPERIKELAPDNFHFNSVNELTYDFKMNYDVTTNPLKPLDKIQFGKDFEGGSSTITYDSDNNFSFQFKKTF